MKIRHLLSIASLLAFAACGGTVVYSEDGGGGDGGAGHAASNGNGNGSGRQASSNAMAGTAGPGGVGGADSGPSLSKSSSGVGEGPGCYYLEEGTTHCYSQITCFEGRKRETECEITNGPGTCWCFLDGAFVGQCEDQDSWCGAQSVCCDAFF